MAQCKKKFFGGKSIMCLLPEIRENDGGHNRGSYHST